MKNFFEEAQRDDERFDIVDKDDRVIGQATRKEVHTKGLRHRAVHVWVFNAAGFIFLQKRSIYKDTAPGKWDSSCSGHVNAGETYDAAAIRELQEEIGLDASVASKLTLVFKSDACRETSMEFTQVYRLFNEGPFSLHPAEIEDGDWFSPMEVDTAINEAPENYSRTFRYLWRTRPADLRPISDKQPPARLQ